MQKLGLDTVGFNRRNLPGEHHEPSEEQQSGERLDIGQRIFAFQPDDAGISAHDDREIRDYIHRFRQLRRQPWQGEHQNTHDSGQATCEHVVQHRMRGVTEHTDAEELDTGEREQNPENDGARDEMGDRVRTQFCLVAMPAQTLPVIRHEFGDGEVADDDDANAAEHECGIEHTGRERGAVAQLGEIVIRPIRVITGRARGADACDDEERKQGRQGFRVHELRLNESQIADDS